MEPRATITIKNTSTRLNTGFSSVLRAGAKTCTDTGGGAEGGGCEVESLRSKNVGGKMPLKTIYTKEGPRKTKGAAF
jgi:hypothetical protein